MQLVKMTFKCVGCKEKKSLGPDELDRVGDLGVFCNHCHMPCVIHEVKTASKRPVRTRR